MDDGFTVLPDVKDLVALDDLARAAMDSKLSAPQSVRRRLTFARTCELQALFSWGKRIRGEKIITTSMAETRRILDRLFAFAIASVVAALIRSKACKGILVEAITLSIVLDVIPHKPKV